MASNWWFFPYGAPGGPGCKPGPCVWIEVLLADGDVCDVHYAFDYSGEYQPVFEGWYRRPRPGEGRGFQSVDPKRIVLWRNKPKVATNAMASK